MSAVASLVLTCDTPGCDQVLTVERPAKAWHHHAEQQAINAGWDLSATEGDHCPDHHPWLPRVRQ